MKASAGRARGWMRALAMLAAFSSVLVFQGNPSIAVAPFADDFEQGDLSRWTFTSGLSVQSVDVLSGAFAARAASSGSPAYAYKTLPNATADLYARASLKVVARQTPTTLLAFRRGDGTHVVRVFLDASGRLAYRNHLNGTVRTSTTVVPSGGWHVLDVRVSIGTASVVEVRLDGALALSGTEALAGVMRQLQIGDHGSGHRFNLVFDDVAADVVPIGAIAPPPTTPGNLRLASAPGTSVNLAWDASSSSAGVAFYVVYRDNVEIATVPGTATTYRDTPPSRDSVYSYAVVAEDASGQRSERSTTLLVTMPDFSRPSDAIVFAGGDIACASKTPTATSCWQLPTSDIFLNQPPDAILALGDNQYEKGTLESYNKSFQVSWGRAKSSILPVPGNHEYNTPGASGYFAYFGSAAGDPAGGYYSTDLGSWHIVALNANCTIVSCLAGSAQHTWLVEDLAADPSQCTLAFFHQPIWSGRRPPNTSVAPLVNALYAAGTELVLVGHDHYYERLAPQNPAGNLDEASGIRQITVGTGGRSLYAFETDLPHSEARDNTTFGLLKLSLHATGYDWSFVPAWGDGPFVDFGSESCH